MTPPEPDYERVGNVIPIVQIANLGFRERKELAKGHACIHRAGTRVHPAHKMPGPFQAAKLCLR